MATKKEQIAQEVAKAVGAGKTVELETVDFNDPNRPKTCLEVDFPILPVNQVAIIEGNAGKPIYQMSKWWARRRSSVFRSMLIAAATKAPDDKTHTAKLVWDNYYANHQKKGAFKNIKVADIFMGGGTTLVEGSRLGMQMHGNDLNPVAWFVVKQELANVDLEEVKKLLADIEAEVKPQIMPFYYCDAPNGEKGIWTHKPSKKIMGADFDPLSLTPEQRPEYDYQGPEIIYTFWAKHGPCQVTGCGHRTPIMSSPVMAVKSISVKHWQHQCSQCGKGFHIEDTAARMSPDVPLYVAPSETPYTVINPRLGVVCPHCEHSEQVKLGKSTNKKIELSLLVHPDWLAGSAKADANGQPFGGSAQDDAESTSRWNKERASKIRLLEVRGTEIIYEIDKKTGETKIKEVIPSEVTCPETKVTFKTGKEGGTVPKKSSYTCAACGTVQDVLTTIKATAKTGAMAGYAIQGYAPKRDASGAAYGGRFFAGFDTLLARQYDAAISEWEERKNTDLKDFYPHSELPYGFMTHHLQGGVPNHGFTHWWTMFNPRQLLVHAQLLKAIVNVGKYDWAVREYVLGAFQQYLRNQALFTIWNAKADKLEPMFANNNYHPKSTVIENCVFPNLGRGNWASCVEGIIEGQEWDKQPWETVSVESLKHRFVNAADKIKGKSEKVYPNDAVTGATISCGSSTELSQFETASMDLVITDPPFGGLLHYSELSDFFYVWLRLALKDKYPNYFTSEYTPKSLEAVANKAREPDDADGFYQRILTLCWKEAHRILKPAGLLAFTFHHSEDEPWVAVLESLFDAGFYLEATYPIRSDETKGEGEFGSKTIEYDIIHVCRKRTEEPKPVSWGRMRREVLADVRQLQQMLENHAKEGLPAADLQVIRRGKALEYFSRHYGKVYVDDDKTIGVRDALIGINELIDEDADKSKEPPPVNAEPMTRQFLRIFDGTNLCARDQLQKFLKGSITTPDEFVQRGWCSEKNKVFTHVDPLAFARDWQGKHKRKLSSDLDQALVLIGSCIDGSGINTQDTLKNDNFKAHIALRALLEWFQKRGADQAIRNAASRALTIFNTWQASQKPMPHTLDWINDDEIYR
jgi:putative DNA methylase